MVKSDTLKRVPLTPIRLITGQRLKDAGFHFVQAIAFASLAALKGRIGLTVCVHT